MLAGQGLVARADEPSTDGRERPWRRVADEIDTATPETSADRQARAAVVLAIAQRELELFSDFLGREPGEPADWRDAITVHTRAAVMSADQLREWGLAVEAVTRDHCGPWSAAAPAAGARLVRLAVRGFPQELPSGARAAVADQAVAPPRPGWRRCRAGRSVRPVRLAFAGTLTARMAQTMIPLTLLLLFRERTGSFAAAGLAVAVSGLAFVAGGPVVARLADRRGPRVLAVAGAVSAASLVLLAVTASPVVSWVAVAAAGASTPPLTAALRARSPPSWPPAATAPPLQPGRDLDGAAVRGRARPGRGRGGAWRHRALLRVRRHPVLGPHRQRRPRRVTIAGTRSATSRSCSGISAILSRQSAPPRRPSRRPSRRPLELVGGAFMAARSSAVQPSALLAVAALCWAVTVASCGGPLRPRARA